MEKIDSGNELPCRMIIRHIKNPLICPFGLAAKILTEFNFASSELRCLPLRRKWGINITCGNWYRLLFGAELKKGYQLLGNKVCKGKKYQHLQLHVLRRPSREC
ncbi:hypothetical protein TNCV_3039431 [Trichonephila clavipes]|nr:hypothetical protein TNCV_3039431 [Trichonephila clavipes]